MAVTQPGWFLTAIFARSNLRGVASSGLMQVKKKIMEVALSIIGGDDEEIEANNESVRNPQLQVLGYNHGYKPHPL